MSPVSPQVRDRVFVYGPKATERSQSHTYVVVLFDEVQPNSFEDIVRHIGSIKHAAEL